MPAPAFQALESACRREPPEVALVLGSGMGDIAARVEPFIALPFTEIPGLPATTVTGHKGRLTLGRWSGRLLLLFEGRLHFYEGHPWEVVERPLRTAAALGAQVALLTNAAGGIADNLAPGSLMAVRDHLDCTTPFWWRQRSPLPSPYSSRLLNGLDDAASAIQTPLFRGIYAAVTGPCYETPAEVRALQSWGADAVGMSTVREVQAAHATGMECAAVSCIANRAAGLSMEPPKHEEVLAVITSAASRLGDLLEKFLENLNE